VYFVAEWDEGDVYVGGNDNRFALLFEVLQYFLYEDVAFYVYAVKGFIYYVIAVLIQQNGG